MAIVKPSFLSPVAVHITLDGLTTGSLRQSDAIDNTSANTVYGQSDGYLICAAFQTASGALGANPNLVIFVPTLSVQGVYTDGATGTDGSFTLPNPSITLPFRQVPITTAATLTYLGRLSLAPAFGDIVDKFTFFVQNNSGLTLATAPGTTSVTAVTNVTNPQVTTGASHGLVVGQTVTISGTVGATGINGTWVVATVPSGTTFTITTAAPGAWSSGGTVAPAINTIQLIPFQYTA